MLGPPVCHINALAVNRLKAAIRLDHGEEDLVHALVVVRAIGEDAIQIEHADRLDGRKQPLLVSLRGFQLLQRLDQQTADHVSLKRAEPDLRIRIYRLQRRLIPGHEREARVRGERDDPGHHHSIPILAEFLGEGVGADEARC